MYIFLFIPSDRHEKIELDPLKKSENYFFYLVCKTDIRKVGVRFCEF